MSTIASQELLINEEIRDREVRLIDEKGNQQGIVTLDVALRMAEEADLDLVKIAPQAVPPVCKIMDYGKYRFEPVSYTHLDVYKRQITLRKISSGHIVAISFTYCRLGRLCYKKVGDQFTILQLIRFCYKKLRRNPVCARFLLPVNSESIFFLFRKHKRKTKSMRKQL